MSTSGRPHKKSKSPSPVRFDEASCNLTNFSSRRSSRRSSSGSMASTRHLKPKAGEVDPMLRIVSLSEWIAESGLFAESLAEYAIAQSSGGDTRAAVKNLAEMMVKGMSYGSTGAAASRSRLNKEALEQLHFMSRCRFLPLEDVHEDLKIWHLTLLRRPNKSKKCEAYGRVPKMEFDAGEYEDLDPEMMARIRAEQEGLTPGGGRAGLGPAGADSGYSGLDFGADPGGRRGSGGGAGGSGTVYDPSHPDYRRPSRGERSDSDEWTVGPDGKSYSSRVGPDGKPIARGEFEIGPDGKPVIGADGKPRRISRTGSKGGTESGDESKPGTAPGAGGAEGGGSGIEGEGGEGAAAAGDASTKSGGRGRASARSNNSQAGAKGNGSSRFGKDGELLDEGSPDGELTGSNPAVPREPTEEELLLAAGNLFKVKKIAEQVIMDEFAGMLLPPPPLSAVVRESSSRPDTADSPTASQRHRLAPQQSPTAAFSSGMRSNLADDFRKCILDAFRLINFPDETKKMKEEAEEVEQFLRDDMPDPAMEAMLSRSNTVPLKSESSFLETHLRMRAEKHGRRLQKEGEKSASKLTQDLWPRRLQGCHQSLRSIVALDAFADVRNRETLRTA